MISADELTLLRKDWRYLLTADLRKSMPTKGAMQDGLRQAVRVIDQQAEELAEQRQAIEMWLDWSNDLARLVPERYNDDIAQEAIIENALRDLVQRFATIKEDDDD